MTAINAWNPQHGRIVERDGSPTPEFQRWLYQTWVRNGGASAPSNNDFAVAAFEDAGIEEIRFDLFRTADALGSMAGQINQLQARLDAAEAEINGLKQGSLI